MKKNFAIGFLMVAFLSPAAFAKKEVSCELKIADNKVKCGLKYLVGACEETALKKSSTKFSVVIEDGESIDKEIKLKEVILNPGTKKQDQSNVIIFAHDERDFDLKTYEDVELASYELSKKIDIHIKYDKANDMVDRRLLMGFDLPVESHEVKIDISGHSSLKLGLQGDGAEVKAYAQLIEGRAVAVTCHARDFNESINQDEQNRKNAIEMFKKEQESQVTHK